MKLNKYIYGLSVFAALALTACSEEVSMPDNGSETVGNPVPMTITVSRGDSQTRTLLTENSAGGLNDVWKEGDELKVFDNNGALAGSLTLESGYDGESEGVFHGTLTTGTEGTYYLWYYNEDLTYIDGSKTTNVFTYTAPESTDNGTESGFLTIDLSKQSSKSVEELSSYDVLYSGAEEIVIENGNASIKNDVKMSPALAMARFNLKGLSDKNGTLKISNAYGNTTRKIKYALAERDNSGHLVNGGEMSSSNGFEVKVVSGNDVYVALPPLTYQFNFEFTTSNGEVFTKALSTTTSFVAGKYYCINTNNVTSGVELDLINLDYIFGLKWANNNTQSIISGTATGYYLLSYIPYINLKSQGYNDDYIFDYESNPYRSYYQWDRDFGFAGFSDGSYYPTTQRNQEYFCPIAGDGYSFGYQNKDGQYWTSSNQCNNNNFDKIYNTLYYPTNQNDWLSNHTATEWESKINIIKTSAIPQGFKMPKKMDWETLLLNEEYSPVKINTQNVFDHSKDESYPYIMYPVKVSNQEDGTCIIWSLVNEFDGNNIPIYVLDIRRVYGNYTIDDIMKEESIILNCDKPLRLHANGYLNNIGQVQNYGYEGYYWAQDCPSTSGYAYAFHFKINIATGNNTLTTEIVSRPRKEVYSVRCLYSE